MQKVAFESYIRGQDIEEFHHGDCIGVDEQACAAIERVWGSPIHTHPPINSSKRAYVGGTLYLPKEYIERNHDIVDAVDVLVVIPAEMHEVRRSGTWATYRYAGKVGTRRLLILPNGDWSLDDPS
jgi:hypothetical protein